MRIPSGVPGFDSLVQGGFPEGAAVVVQGPAGKEKDAFLFQFIADGLRENASVLVVLSSVSPTRYQQELKDAGIDVDRAIAENRLKFVDWFTYKEETVQDVEQSGPIFRASIDLANVGIAISRAISAVPREGAKRAAVEVLSPALSVYDLPAVYGFAQSTKAKLERFGFTALFVLEKEMHDERTLSSLHQPFDGVVDIERVREGDQLVRKVVVLSLKATAAESKYVPLEVGADHLLRVAAMSERELTLRKQEELIRTNPKDSKVWLATARNLHGMGENERALKSAEAALRLEPADADAWQLKAIVLDALGRHDEAATARLRATTPPAPAVKRDDVTARLMAVVDQRLAQNPRDADALFVKAAALAKGGDVGGAIVALEALSLFDDAYPGLWILKAKIHARRGEPEKARAARLRAQEAERRLERLAQERESPGPPTPPRSFECPRCGASVRNEDTSCLSCGVGFEAAEQAPAAREIHPPKSKPELARRGMTNGLARTTPRGAGRTNGLVNGLRGRTNGLVNGIRGRTNGLVNGTRGRTNGLVNGTRGRTNGVTNGLVNGLHSLRSGMTNGLTNGSGFTNGLGSSRWGSESKARRWQLYAIPLVATTLFLIPLLVSVGPYPGAHPIAIDGSFGDWGSVPLVSQAPQGGVNPNADLIRFGVTDNVDSLAFYMEVNGTALAGGGAPPTMDTFRVFLDTDRDSRTGYRVQGLGADGLIEISGYGGLVRSSLLWSWDANRDVLDWGGWIRSVSIPAASLGSRMEAEVDWLALGADRPPIDALMHAMSYDGASNLAEYAVSTTAGSVRVVDTPLVPEIVGGSMVPLVRLDLKAAGRAVTYDSLKITLTGTAPPGSASALHLTDGTGVDLGLRVPMSSDVAFQFPPRTVSAGGSDELRVFVDTSATTGDTLGARLEDPRDLGAGPAAVTIVRAPALRAVGYLGVIPSAVRIDGGFGEWNATRSDPTGEAGVPERVDLAEYAFYLNAQQASLYFRVAGRVLEGALVPASPASDPGSGGGPTPPDGDRDSVPDDADPMPNDFNNDGISDASSGNDYDGDGITDYPAGPDAVLNTTIPATFPAPYGGRAVTVFIGPTDRPVVRGEDVAWVFLDADNDSATGYRVGGLGADYLIEARGKHGAIVSHDLRSFGGASPWEWSWSPAQLTQAASDYSRAELAFPVTGLGLANETLAYFDLRDWSGTSDDSQGPTPRLGTRSAPSPPQVLDISGNGVFWLRNTNHATETACTVNKVAQDVKGGGPATVTSLTTGQSACWYVDQTTGATIPAGDWEALLDLSVDRGIVGYGEGSVTTPRYRIWDGSAFGNEASAAAAAATIQWIVVKPSSVNSDDVIMGVLASNNNLYVQTWNGASWTANWNTAVGDSITRRFDVAFEQSSGDAVVVFGDGTSQMKYRKRVGGTWDGSNQNAGTALADLPYWIRAESRPTNDDIFVGVLTNGGTFHAMRWNGATNAWGDQVQMAASPSSKDQEAMDIAFERASGDAFVLWGDQSNNLKYREFTTAWQAETNAYAGMADKPFWVVATFDPISSSSKIAVGMVLNNGNFEFGAWDGSAWVSRPVAIAARDKAERGMDVAFEKDTGKALYIYDTSANPNQMTWRTWTSSGGFSSGTAQSGSSGAINTMQLRSDPYTNEVMALYADANSDLFHRLWSGSAWTALGTALEASLSSVTTMREAFMFAWTTRPEYDVVFEIWNKDTDSVVETIGSCLDQTAVGDDVRCFVSGVAQKTIASNQVVRLRLSHSSSYGTLRIEYGDSDSSGDSRITIPIPEFQDIAVPVVAILAPVVWIWSRRRARARPRRAGRVT